MRFQIENMTCGGCARSVTMAIRSVDPVATVEADLQSHSLTIRSDKPREAFLPALEEAGYPADRKG
jgi:copper chaperone